ncbi:MAG: methyltransferase domain-containing protein [Chloroflexi bacterium]|nr:methyltransferase domain-containing protein [Chloroflexota bacterium]
MTIDFHAQNNRYTYATRVVDSSWVDLISSLIQPEGKTVLDIGCGGGIYSLAWAEIGVKQVIGVDFSEHMIETARENLNETSNVSFHVGNAISTGRVSGTADIVFQRALIHHISDLSACVSEAHRLLVPNGEYLIQDRTPEDVKYPSSSNHIRGFFFERYPRLLEIENNRRRSIENIERHLFQSGFTNLTIHSIWETRRGYADFAELASDLTARTGRSILHELTDQEIQDLIAYIRVQLPKGEKIVEKDRWTIWYAQKAA